jgi:hypothetical protein
MGRHQRPRGARPRGAPQFRPRFGLAPLILAGAIVISYAVLRASGASTIMFAPPTQPPAMSGIHPAGGRDSAQARPSAAGPAPASRAGQAGTSGSVSVVCQFTGGIVCGVNAGQATAPAQGRDCLRLGRSIKCL